LFIEASAGSSGPSSSAKPSAVSGPSNGTGSVLR
jgi:hypothetical protein